MALKPADLSRVKDFSWDEALQVMRLARQYSADFEGYVAEWDGSITNQCLGCSQTLSVLEELKNKSTKFMRKVDGLISLMEATIEANSARGFHLFKKRYPNEIKNELHAVIGLKEELLCASTSEEGAYFRSRENTNMLRDRVRVVNEDVRRNIIDTRAYMSESQDRGLPSTTRGSAQIIKVYGHDNPARNGNVIFIHGLEGDAERTWHPEKRRMDAYWPDWIGQEIANIGVYSVGYPVYVSLLVNKSLPLSDLATLILAMLDTDGLEKHPIVFIGHSFGGLLIKKILQQGDGFGDPKWQAIVSQTKGVVFLATPHLGAIEDWLYYVSQVIFPTVTVRELRTANYRSLAELNRWYQSQSRRLGIKTQVYYETEKTNGIMVVKEADPWVEGVTPVPVPSCNHIDICKPKSRGDIVHKRVVGFIRELFVVQNY